MLSSPPPVYIGAPTPSVPDDPDARIAAHYVLGLVAIGAEAGIDLEELIALSGLTAEQMGDPEAYCTATTSAAMLRRVEAAIPGESIGLRFTDMMLAGLPPAVTLAAQSAPTFGEAMLLQQRYQPISMDQVRTWIDVDGDLAVYRGAAVPTLRSLRHTIEGFVMFSVTLMRTLGLRQEDLVEVHFDHAPFGDPALYRDWYGCPVHFDSFASAIILRAAAHDRPPTRPDPILYRSLLDRLEADFGDGTDQKSRLRREVAAHAMPAQYSATAIAARMGTSLRSLQRQASTAGTTLREVIEDVRIARSRELLRDPSLSVDDIGFLVDYSDRAAFSRAFKRATGQTPVDYRRSLVT